MSTCCLAEGTYRLEMKSREDGPGGTDTADGTALAILRDGQILGSGRWGGVFHGSHRYDQTTGLNHIRITLEVPPQRCLMTGFRTGAEAAMVDIVGAMRSDGRQASAVVEVAGAPLEVALTYLAPPPG